jgi:glycerol-3-phosphate cytidylyltransferase
MIMNKKVGFTASAFDLLHAGHVAMLEEAKEQCDWLIVGLQTDPTIDRPEKNKPIQTITERYIQLRACKFVDEIYVYATEADLMDLLAILPIDVRIIGSDYIDKDFTGKQFCWANDIGIYYNRRSHKLSTSELRSRLKG